MANPPTFRRLKKELGLADVFAISTGAMFSSGFFLLPGLAAAKTGPSVSLAYLLAGVLIIPAMLAAAELSTAMPRAGGAYYFIDRSLGPGAGTVGGLGTWIALVLKSAFALIGMGAYLALFVHLDIEPVAIGLTVLFVILNVVGAKETTGLQKALVFVLIVILGVFVGQGILAMFTTEISGGLQARLRPFAPFGATGLISTIGFVFVSYAGLTKVASVSEEVSRPDRNIPLGMLLSLIAATVIYVIGVFIIVAVVDADTLRSDLTPVATAAERIFGWMPGSLAVGLVVVAAVAAFASTANAGIMAASRYLLAMSRDRLLWPGFGHLGRFHTPTIAVLATGAAMIFIVIAIDVEGVAKLASAFQLLLFAILNLAVIVMRESHIESYDPGYRSPWYPWTQLLGIVIYLGLIVMLGWLPIAFTGGLVALSLVWFHWYGRRRAVRSGAIYHVFERWGRQRFAGIDHELREIIKEKGLRDQDPFEEVVARAFVVRQEDRTPLSQLIRAASGRLHARVPVTGEQLVRQFEDGFREGVTPVSHGAALLHTRVAGLPVSELVLAQCTRGVDWDIGDRPTSDGEPVLAVFFLVSDLANPGVHLRILGAIAGRIEDEDFIRQWLEAKDDHDLKATLLRTDRVLGVDLRDDGPTAELVGKALRELGFPPGVLVAMIRRHGDSMVPRADTVLRVGDRITIIGEPEQLRRMEKRYEVA